LHLCSNNPSGDLSIQPTGGIAPLVFDIPGVGSDTASMTGADTTGEFMTIQPGTYTFTVTDSLGCSVSGNFVIPQAAINDQFTLAADSTSCFGTNINDGVITVTPTTSQNAPFSYSINGVDYQQDSVFMNLAPGTYQVTVKNTYGCLTNLTADVGQPAKAIVTVTPDTIITAPGISNQVTVTVDQYNTPVYLWNPTTGLSCSDCANPTVSVDSNTTYVVVVSDSNNIGCYTSGSLVVIVSGGVIMPNAFTPNGDGRNDFFGPVKSSVSNVTAYRVYDRWGVMVHNSIEPWDGRYKGTSQGAGTYVYYIAIETPDPENPGSNKTINQQGSVVLLR
jgi:gliding motility-associated-like protein